MKTVKINSENIVTNVLVGEVYDISGVLPPIEDDVAVCKGYTYDPDTGVFTEPYCPECYECYDEETQSWVIDIDLLKRDRLDQVNALYIEKISADFDYTYSLIDYAFDADPSNLSSLNSRWNYANSSITDGTSYPWSGDFTKWNDNSDNVVEFASASDFITFANTVYARNEACKRQQTTHKNAIRALSDSQDILDYDITTGW